MPHSVVLHAKVNGKPATIEIPWSEAQRLVAGPQGVTTSTADVPQESATGTGLAHDWPSQPNWWVHRQEEEQSK